MRTLVSLLAVLCLAPAGLWADKRLDQYYSSGFQAWNQGNYLKARNQWYRFLSLRAQNENNSDPRKEDKVKFFYSALEKRLAPKPRKRKINLPPPAPVERVVVQADPILKQKKIKDLLFKARLARKYGHLEKAQELFQMAEVLDPQQKSIQKELAEIEREIKRN